MTMDLALKPNTDAGGGHDIAIVDGDFVRAVGADAVRQDIEMTLRTFLGENVYDKNVGVPYIEVIFQRGVSLTAVRFILEQAILARRGVGQVLALDVSLNATTRVASVSGRVLLDTNEVLEIGAEAIAQ
jgi:hypothetical protein